MGKYPDFLLACRVYLEERGLPIPTDLTIEAVNAGVTSEDVQNTKGFIDLYHFVVGACEASEEEIDELDLGDDMSNVVRIIRELID